MSRSYKKTSVIKDGYGCKSKKWHKRQASKATRRYTNYLAKGSDYKKVYCSYNICDYKFWEPWNVYTKSAYKSKEEWAKMYYHK